MSNNSFKVKNSVVLTPKNLSTLTSPEAGELACDINDANKIKRYNADSASWVEVGSGGGGINYIENDDFEAGTTGWSIYEDAPGDAPVDGTGIISAPNLSLSVSTSLPLRGLKSAFINKASGGASRGNGLSCNFTIDKADQAQVLRVSFDYSADSGYSDGNFRVYVYDVTNAQLIEVIDRDVLASSQGKYVGTFQTSSNSTSYRLCIHSTDTSTSSSYSFQLDNVVVGPQSIVKGPIVTDWISYTPTFSAGFGTTTLQYARYRRNGSDILIEGAFTTGTVATGVGTLSLPIGILIGDYGVTSSAQGTWRQGGASTDDFTSGTFRLVTGNSTVTFTDDFSVAASSGSPNSSPNVNSIFRSASPVYFQISFRVQGWSSNVVLSEDAGNREIVFKALGNPTSTAFNNTANLIWGSVNVGQDTTASYNATTGEYTIPESGIYDIVSTVLIAGTEALNTSYTLSLFVNGVALEATSDRAYAAGVTFQNSTLVTQREFSKGDVLALRINTDVGSPSIASSSAVNKWAIAKRSSPQTIATSEIVQVNAQSTSGAAIGTTSSIYVYETKFVDTHNAYNSSTGVFTAPQTGYYRISAALRTANVTLTTSQFLLIQLTTSIGGTWSRGIVFGNGGSAGYQAQFSGVVPLSKGETASIQISSSVATTSTTTGAYTYLSISKVNGVS